jgi:hypothetical protein
VNDFQDKVTGAAGTVPGSTLELPAGMVIDMPRSSLPVKSWSTAAAALKVECPEMYSANGLECALSSQTLLHRPRPAAD